MERVIRLERLRRRRKRRTRTHTGHTVWSLGVDKEVTKGERMIRRILLQRTGTDIARLGR